MSITSEIRLRVRKEGDVVLNQLSAKLNDVASRSTLTSAKFKDLSATLKQTDSQIRTKSINGLNDYARAWRELANSVDITSKEFREATREAQRFEQAAAKAQGRRGGGRLAGMARTAGAVAAAGIFGGPEGLIGAGIGGILGGGAVGAGVGGAIGAQVGMFRQSLGEIASFSAELSRQQMALEGVVKTQNEYAFALEAVSKATKDFAIPTSVLTREFTKLQASVAGSGGTVEDTDKAFRAIVASIRATGGSIEDVRSALTATAQVFSKGKVSAEELRQQIGERLPGAFTIFAKSMGKTPAELDKALEKGEVSLQDFMGFVERLLDEYEDNAKKIASGPDAAGDRLKVVLEDLKKTTGPILKDIGASFQSFAADAAQAIDGLIKKMIQFGKQMEEKLGGQLLQNAIKNVQVQDKVIKQLETEALVRVGGLSKTEQQQLQLAKTLRAGSLRVIEGAKLGPQAPSAPSALPGIDPDKDNGKKGRKQKIKQMSEEVYQISLRQIQAQKEENNLLVAQLNFEVERQSLKEQFAAKQIDQRTYDIKLQEAGLKLAKNVEKVESQISDKLQKQADFRATVEAKIQDALFSAQNLNEEELKRIQINRTLAEVIDQAMKAGVENMQELLDLINRLRDAMQGGGEKKGFKDAFKDGIESMGNLAENLGSSLANAFGGAADALADFISTGKANFKDFARSVLQDLSRIFMRYAMFQAVKSIFKLDFSANGNVMTSKGPMPLKKYASGGIARSPQISVFGEGSTPEAYVPLPDGRSIPVKMKGGGNDGNITVNVDARGTSVQGDNDQGARLGRAISVAVQQELIRQRRPGGLLT